MSVIRCLYLLLCFVLGTASASFNNNNNNNNYYSDQNKSSFGKRRYEHIQEDVSPGSIIYEQAAELAKTASEMQNQIRDEELDHLYVELDKLTIELESLLDNCSAQSANKSSPIESEIHILEDEIKALAPKAPHVMKLEDMLQTLQLVNTIKDLKNQLDSTIVMLRMGLSSSECDAGKKSYQSLHEQYQQAVDQLRELNLVFGLVKLQEAEADVSNLEKKIDKLELTYENTRNDSEANKINDYLEILERNRDKMLIYIEKMKAEEVNGWMDVELAAMNIELAKLRRSHLASKGKVEKSGNVSADDIRAKMAKINQTICDIHQFQ